MARHFLAGLGALVLLLSLAYAQNVTYNVAATMTWLQQQGCVNSTSNPTCPGGYPCYDAEFTARALAAGSVVALDPNDPDSAPYQAYNAMGHVYDLTTQAGLQSFLQDLGWYTAQPAGCTPTNPDACFPQGAIIMTQNSWQQPVPVIAMGNAICSCWSPLTTNGPHCGMGCAWFGGTELYFPPIPKINGPLFGSYTPNNQTYQDFTSWPNMMNTPEDAINQAVSVIEVGWSNNDAANVENVLNLVWTTETAVPVITWMPYNYKSWNSSTPNMDIVNGKYDDYIDQVLTMLSGWVQGKRAYLRFAPQPNGNWFPWNPTCPSCNVNGQNVAQTAASYVSMWNYVIGKVRSDTYNLTADVLLVMFDVNNADANTSHPMEKFYPGDSTVDWFCITGFNWANTLPGNNWSTPTQIFSAMTTRVQALSSANKPRALSSASSSAQNGIWGKYAWIPTLFQYELDSKAKMLLYHNADSSTDLAAFGGSAGTSTWTAPLSQIEYNVYESLSDALNNLDYGIQGANYSNPLFITAAQFAGNF